MLKRAQALFLGLLSPVIALAMAGNVSAESATRQLNMPQGVTEVSQAAYDIHMIMMWICTVIGIAVFGFMFYVMYAHRKSRGAVAANFHENHVVELIWTIVPALILIVMAIPATTALLKVYDTENADIDIKVTGYQWKWQYEYIGEGVKYMSELRTSQDEIYGRAPKGEHYLREVTEPLVIPTGKKVRFLITGNDVIHSWWVPDFGVKRDAVPGLFTAAWAKTDVPGTYVGECTELCGIGHAFMPVVVEVKEEAEYNEWLAGKKAEVAEYASTIGKEWTFDELMVRGEEVYERSCAACHQSDGNGIPGVFPALKDSPIALGAKEGHIAVLIDGVAGTSMQSFADQLSEVDIAAVVHYERNAWGNDVGDVTQPIDVLNYKQGQ
ncbi:cytochrome c oxidase subunit II [SAR92 clade bacterium H231]|jgi:cytochrome c oxidase subunit 2|nr:cytochrome c oxidase subunit II [Porticoccaceae bacterium]MCT2532919.1 cytochrome c oxidase subunit II [SAR92 clade bacterium H231]MBT6319804.1 cytochrome c oxidase subunit II [Porticoccaceae bacterium]MBT7258000.1 cytochrome c oxidase subunit II [Porticoccaceae bacterium]MBT7905742.1 cytochrome c oxidase subunit II [Porticoccaceae bacterium]